MKTNSTRKKKEKVPCDCPKGGLYENENGSTYPCPKCGGSEWVNAIYKNEHWGINEGHELAGGLTEPSYQLMSRGINMKEERSCKKHILKMVQCRECNKVDLDNLLNDLSNLSVRKESR